MITCLSKWKAGEGAFEDENYRKEMAIMRDKRGKFYYISAVCKLRIGALVLL
jgi:hypothetical protein